MNPPTVATDMGMKAHPKATHGTDLPHAAGYQLAEWTLLISWRIIGPMKSESREAVIGERKQSLEDRLKRIESDIAILKEKVGIRD